MGFGKCELVFLCACAVVVCPAVEPEAWQEARKLYYEGVEGNRAAEKQASARIAALHARFPDDPVITAYRGSTLLLESSRAFAPWRKGKLAKEGLMLMDAAVDRDPGQLEARFVRAASTMNLPAFFKRAAASESDFAWLAPKMEQAAKTGALDRRLAAAALLYHGINREKSGDQAGARAAWQAAAGVGSGLPPGDAAAKRLESSIQPKDAR